MHEAIGVTVENQPKWDFDNTIYEMFLSKKVKKRCEIQYSGDKARVRVSKNARIDIFKYSMTNEFVFKLDMSRNEKNIFLNEEYVESFVKKDILEKLENNKNHLLYFVNNRTELDADKEKITDRTIYGYFDEKMIIVQAMITYKDKAIEYMLFNPIDENHEFKSEIDDLLYDFSIILNSDLMIGFDSIKQYAVITKMDLQSIFGSIAYIECDT